MNEIDFRHGSFSNNSFLEFVTHANRKQQQQQNNKILTKIQITNLSRKKIATFFADKKKSHKKRGIT